VAILDALRQIPNLKVATRPTAQNPTVILVALEGAKYDLGDLARTVAGTRTRNRAKGAPSAALLLTSQERDGRAAVPGERKTIGPSWEAEADRGGRLARKKRGFKKRRAGRGGARRGDIKKPSPGPDTEYYPRR